MSETKRELPPEATKEMDGGKPVTFMVAERGLETSVDEVLSKSDFDARRPEDFEPNRNWSEVTVANEEDKKKWVDLRNEYLEAAWTPNQDDETRERNARRMREIEGEMRELENKVRKSE